jgi:serine/threonine-protein kinase
MADEKKQDPIVSGPDETEKTGAGTLKIKGDRYHIETLIGKGGMGEIYKARDPRLKRCVALKFLWHENPENIKRFVREAQAQAKVKHENICRVYEVGETEGKSYIAMQYIDGKPLNKLSRDMTLEQKVKVIKEVAEAIHEAHRMGLVHRDLKPANIIIEQQTDGELKPFVVDFGIAREQEAPQLTITGMAVGTPHYMAPEQARGDYHKLDRRTDIYALGVTLYQLLSNRFPITGSTPMEILMKVLQDDPPRLKRIEPSIPQDLNIIVMKCLEKDPVRRYDSARALAEDLQHYLDDEPILAKKTSPVYRLRKKIHKHKTLSAVIFAALMIILFLAGFGLKVLVESRERAALAQRFGQKIKEIETIMRFAYMLPLHNTSEEKTIVKKKIKEIEDEMKRVGSAARGPGKYALGRGFLSLQDFDNAYQYLEEAWNSNYKEPEVAYALGQVLGVIYQKKLEEVEAIKNEKLREERMREIVKRYRLPALTYLKLSQGVKLGAPIYIEGLIAFYEERYQRALTYARDAHRQTPWLYEAYRLEGDIYAKLAKNKRHAGEIKEALSHYEQAEKAYNQAISIARSDSLNYGGLAGLRAGMLILTVRLGKSPDSVMEKLLDACDRAIRTDPDNADAYNIKSFAYSLQGYFLANKGDNPGTAFQKAIGAARYSLKIKPGYYDAWSNLGMAYQIKADYEITQGLDPGDSLKNAIQCLSRAIQLKSNLDYPFTNLGNTYWSLAMHEKGLGRSPLPSFNNAISAFNKALAMVPDYSINLTNLAGVLVNKADYELEQGIDPSASLSLAVANSERAITINPEFPAFYMPLAVSRLITAEYKILTGGNPGPSLEQAVETLQKVEKIDNTNIELRIAKARSCFLRGWHQRLFNKSPYLFFSRAKKILEKVLKRRAGLSEALALQARMELLLGKWRIIEGQSPSIHIGNALNVLKQLTGSSQGLMRGYLGMAEAYQMQAAWRTMTKVKIGNSIEKSRACLENVFKIDAKAAEALVIKGILTFLTARNAVDNVQRKSPDTEAKELIARAFEVNEFLKRKYKLYLAKIGMKANGTGLKKNKKKG